jgi:hypothetical protein
MVRLPLEVYVRIAQFALLNFERECARSEPRSSARTPT